MKRWIKRLKTRVDRWRAGTPPAVRRMIVGVIGTTLLLIGIAMIILPGPAFIVIPVSLAILATEFVWARHALDKAKEIVQKAKEKASRVKRQTRANG